jgi:hypothetical protein
MQRSDAAALVAAAAVVALAGCSGLGGSESQGSTRQPDPDVSLTGTFRVVGGPTPGIDKPLVGTLTFEGPVTEETTATHGTFTVDLPPGDYVVTAQPHGHFAAAACLPTKVTVLAAQTPGVEVACVVE